MRILHVIPGLRMGGAEAMLYKLVSLSRGGAFAHEVVALTDARLVGERIQGLGVPVQCLGLDRIPTALSGAWRLAAHLRRRPPDLVQTWQYHADLIGGLATRLMTCAPVVWNVRHSDFDAAELGRVLRWTLRACTLVSRRLPEHIVCCSEVGRRIHLGLGYPAERMTVIPNGFDLDEFRPDRTIRATKRAELGIGKREVLIGLVGRVRPQKDHATFLAAAARMGADFPELRFLFCGPGTALGDHTLAGLVRNAGLAERCLLLGPRSDVAEIDAALDIACSSSATEGFSNVIGEAMACGVPCVVTDVGDSAWIVGDTGLVVPRRDPDALAGALSQLVAIGAEGREALGRRARLRVERNFNLAAIVERYEDLYVSLVRARRRACSSAGVTNDQPYDADAAKPGEPLHLASRRHIAGL
jgi:glycosyltransferase involved in cell wall biosynthesis